MIIDLDLTSVLLNQHVNYI